MTGPLAAMADRPTSYCLTEALKARAKLNKGHTCPVSDNFQVMWLDSDIAHTFEGKPIAQPTVYRPSRRADRAAQTSFACSHS
jgi:hypothetical protein